MLQNTKIQPLLGMGENMTLSLTGIPSSPSKKKLKVQTPHRLQDKQLITVIVKEKVELPGKS